MSRVPLSHATESAFERARAAGNQHASPMIPGVVDTGSGALRPRPPAATSRGTSAPGSALPPRRDQLAHAQEGDGSTSYAQAYVPPADGRVRPIVSLRLVAPKGPLVLPPPTPPQARAPAPHGGGDAADASGSNDTRHRDDGDALATASGGRQPVSAFAFGLGAGRGERRASGAGGVGSGSTAHARVPAPAPAQVPLAPAQSGSQSVGHRSVHGEPDSTSVASAGGPSSVPHSYGGESDVAIRLRAGAATRIQALARGWSGRRVRCPAPRHMSTSTRVLSCIIVCDPSFGTTHRLCSCTWTGCMSSSKRRKRRGALRRGGDWRQGRHTFAG